MKYRFAVLDAPPGLNAQQAIEWREYVNFDSSFAAMYYPWIRIPDLSGANGNSKLVPPSGHVVGICNRSDAERGVHKAPANEVVMGAIDLELKLSKGEQDMLNPIGVNCIRAFPGRGIRVWGGRTLSSDGAWRYINVRRLFIMVEASMDAGLQWVVFEPNDTTLWAKVRRDVTSFLRVVCIIQETKAPRIFVMARVARITFKDMGEPGFLKMKRITISPIVNSSAAAICKINLFMKNI